VEVMRPLPVERVAGAPDCVTGLAIVRGKAVPVVELAGLLGDVGNETVEPAAAARWVALRVGDRTVVLEVDAVLAIRSLDAARFTALPPLWHGPRPPAVAALCALDRELFIVLETTRLLPDGMNGFEAEAVACAR
jgi:purine-binding chemotaxis protein CheW